MNPPELCFPLGISILAGLEVTLKATPKFNYTFRHWIDADSGDIISTSSEYKLKVNRDYKIKGVFARIGGGN